MQQNPFLIDIEDKDEYNINDYTNIQNQLNNKKEKICKIIQDFFPPQCSFYEYSDFEIRCTRGITQKLIYVSKEDVSNNLLPTKNLYKVGDGGNGKNCIVCCTPIFMDTDKTRYLASQNILKSLEQVGFNGYFYLFNGGFPNPTGTEMKYIGVPYCFKIFMMLEAKKKGFEKVIWIDARCYSINNPQPLFDILYDKDILATLYSSNNNYNAMVFKPTIELLNKINNIDLCNSVYVWTCVFGLNMVSETIEKIIGEYYEMVKLGYPFFSIFPEEIVLTSIFNKEEYKHLLHYNPDTFKLVIHENRLNENDAKEQGFYFFNKSYTET